MDAVAPLILTEVIARQIEDHGVSAYPSECCGAMMGVDITDADGRRRRVVERLERLENSFEADEQYHRFALNPRDLMRVEKQAGDAGKLVLGFYHSHPDHPARPSEYDREHAWPFWSYVIVAISKGQPQLMTSWVLNDATEQFQEQEVQRGIESRD